MIYREMSLGILIEIHSILNNQFVWRVFDNWVNKLLKIIIFRYDIYRNSIRLYDSKKIWAILFFVEKFSKWYLNPKLSTIKCVIIGYIVKSKSELNNSHLQMIIFRNKAKTNSKYQIFFHKKAAVLDFHSIKTQDQVFTYIFAVTYKYH